MIEHNSQSSVYIYLILTIDFNDSLHNVKAYFLLVSPIVMAISPQLIVNIESFLYGDGDGGYGDYNTSIAILFYDPKPTYMYLVFKCNIDDG